MKTIATLIIASTLFFTQNVTAQQSNQNRTICVTINEAELQATLAVAMEDLSEKLSQIQMLEVQLKLIQSDSPNTDCQTYTFGWSSIENDVEVTTQPEEESGVFMGESLEPMPEEEVTLEVPEPKKAHRELKPGEFVFMGDIYKSLPQEDVNFRITM